ncbi:hypothetical protein [Halobellus limi]|uniref:Uncharacterized protein n=1 Tax=Halobellus limi TaxID=699433 RepID=A0A1H5ZJL4_9EURY|nr:hypothetical protein [Halobellus limi]QCC48076.1 hypothetical protein DV707_10630 [Halobellus limi]SEG36270.1 hypothetical protein SAMN04488133_2020 [Halobellus limi]
MSSEEISQLAAGLPGWFPKSPQTNNYKVLVAVGNSAADRVAEIADVQDAVRVQDADTIEQLAELATPVGVTHRENEPIETFRTRIIAAYQALTSEGTANDLIVRAATLLDVSPESISYADSAEAGVIVLSVPGQAVNDLSISVSEFVNILSDLISAGYRLESTTLGTLEYISPAEYDSGTYNTSAGYDGLDINDDPIGSGGTYSGILR